MEEIMKYVKPELLMVAVVLYFIGIGLKQSQAVRDKYIPLILGESGLCYVRYGALHPVRQALDRKLQWQYLQQLYRES